MCLKQMVLGETSVLWGNIMFYNVWSNINKCFFFLQLTGPSKTVEDLWVVPLNQMYGEVEISS